MFLILFIFLVQRTPLHNAARGGHLHILKYLAKTAQIDIKDYLGVSVRGYIAEWRLGVLFLCSLTRHSRKATVYAKSLNQCRRNCSGHSSFAIGSCYISAVSLFHQSCVQLYTCTCAHFSLKYTVKTLPVDDLSMGLMRIDHYWKQRKAGQSPGMTTNVWSYWFTLKI